MMKRPALWLLGIAIAGWGMVSCSQKNFVQNQGLCTATSAGDTVVMGQNSAVTLFAPCRDKIEATVTQVMDSRCPVDVTCVWAGRVNVMLQFDPTFVLNLEKGKLVDTVYGGRHYSFNVLDVTPYPNSKSPAKESDRRITLLVRRN